jgi:hypothetical protein
MNDTKPKFADLIARRDRRLANARRLYNEELPEAALNAFADWQENPSLGATPDYRAEREGRSARR